MTRLHAIALLTFCIWGLPSLARAQAQPDWEIEALSDEGWVEYDPATRIAVATNGVMVKYGGAVLTAERVSVNEPTGEVIADGRVRIQREEQVWASEHLSYNFKTRQMTAEQFRTGKPPIFAGGYGLHGDLSNSVYLATNAFVTAEDTTHPLLKVRAKHLKIIPGKRFVANGATLYLGPVPIFYFPYYSRSLGPHPNDFYLTPGYRTIYGPFLLGRYTWWLNDQLEGVVHLDYRGRRGVGAGPDVDYHLGRWGEGSFRYYYLHDQDPNTRSDDVSIPENRQRVYFSYDALPFTNFSVKALARYQGDPYIVRDFFEGEYRRNPQPYSFIEADKFWDNFSLNAYAQPRANEFLETVERLPDIRLTGYRQQLGVSPLYYESESSAGYYRRLFAEDAGTNGAPPGLNYEAGRADTFHQVLLPETFFGWLNFIPRVGGRLTYYSTASGPGATTDDTYRGVFNTGAELNFKASRLWPEAQNSFLEVDGLRHILQPSVNYVFVPDPTRSPQELPQFDYRFPSLRLLPIEFPDYNAIDSIDSENVLRLGLKNKLQTKRAGEVANLLNWDLYTDWRLKPRANQTTFADLYSDLALKPRSWLTLESLVRYDIQDGLWRMSLHTITFQPNDIWSWGLGHWYLRDDVPPPEGLGIGNNLFTSMIFFRVNENWALRASHHFEARDGRMEEQYYTVYRDLRSWTAALSFIVRDNRVGPTDFTVAFTFSLKAFPRYRLGADTVHPYSILGY